MKRVIFIILLFIEVLGLFAISIIYAQKKADSCGAIIVIPTDFRLTLANDVFVSDIRNDYCIPKNSTIEPCHIECYSVYFYDKTTEVMVVTSWENIKEKNKLMQLEKEAEAKKQNDQKAFIKSGILAGFLIGCIWLFVGLVLTVRFNKEKRTAGLITVHLLTIIIIMIVCYLSFVI